MRSLSVRSRDSRAWRLLVSSVLVIVVTLVAPGMPQGGSAAAADTSDTATATSDSSAFDALLQQRSYLFVVSAEAGTISGIGRDTGKETLTVTLRGVASHATQFADRPFRDAYVLSTRDLAVRWERWFKSAAPNAVLSYRLKNDPLPHNVVLQLWKPRYTKAAGTLTFVARHTHRAQDPSPDASSELALPKRMAPVVFSSASMFIDSVGDYSFNIYWEDGTVWNGVGGPTVAWNVGWSKDQMNHIDIVIEGCGTGTIWTKSWFTDRWGHYTYTVSYPPEPRC